MKEGTKATRETKVTGDEMESMGERVKVVSPVFPAVKALQEEMVCKESLGRRETLVLLE